MSFVYMLLISCVRSKSRMEKPIFIYRLCCLDCHCSGARRRRRRSHHCNNMLWCVFDVGDSVITVCTSSADRCVGVDTTRWSSISTVGAEYDMICCNDVYVAHIMCSAESRRTASCCLSIIGWSVYDRGDLYCALYFDTHHMYLFRRYHIRLAHLHMNPNTFSFSIHPSRI